MRFHLEERFVSSKVTMDVSPARKEECRMHDLTSTCGNLNTQAIFEVDHRFRAAIAD